MKTESGKSLIETLMTLMPRPEYFKMLVFTTASITALMGVAYLADLPSRHKECAELRSQALTLADNNKNNFLEESELRDLVGTMYQLDPKEVLTTSELEGRIRVGVSNGGILGVEPSKLTPLFKQYINARGK